MNVMAPRRRRRRHEAFVSVHFASGASLGWRGDVAADDLATGLRPAPLRLRPSVAAAMRWLLGGGGGRGRDGGGGGGGRRTGGGSPEEGSKQNQHQHQRQRTSSYSWGDRAVAWLVRLPSRLAYFLVVLRQVSVSLALLNSLPVYGLDGQLAAVQFIRLWLLSAPPPTQPRRVGSQSDDEE